MEFEAVAVADGWLGAGEAIVNEFGLINGSRTEGWCGSRRRYAPGRWGWSFCRRELVVWRAEVPVRFDMNNCSSAIIASS